MTGACCLKEDLHVQQELWLASAARPRRQHQPPKRRSIGTQSQVDAIALPQVGATSNVEQQLSARSLVVRQTELERALQHKGRLLDSFESKIALEDGFQGAVLGSCNVGDASSDKKVHQPRPPRGCAYNGKRTGDETRPRLTLWERFGSGEVKGSAEEAGQERRLVSQKVLAVQAQVDQRQARIEELEKAMHSHDAERFARLSEGTQLLLDDEGQPWLPAPPQDIASPIAHKGRIRVLRHIIPGLGARSLAASSITRDPRSSAGGEQEEDAPSCPMAYPNCPHRQAVVERLHAWELENSQPIKQSLDKPAATDGERTNAAVRGFLTEKREIAKRDHTHLMRLDVADLSQEAEKLAQQETNDDQWLRLANVVCSKAYEIPVAESLKIAAVLGKQAEEHGDQTRTGREHSRSVDQMLYSLTWRLKDADYETLVKVVEVMADTGTASQIYFDMVMVQVVACEHKDPQSLRPELVLRMATALGRLASKGLVELEGEAPAALSTNQRAIKRLHAKVRDSAAYCSAAIVANLSGYYVTRLCNDDTRVALVCRMAELEVGLTEETKHRLPHILKLQEGIELRCTSGFKWSVPYSVRKYWEALRQLRLEHTSRLPVET